MLEENHATLSKIFTAGALAPLALAATLTCDDAWAGQRVIDLAFDPAPNSCATRLYATQTPYGQYEVVKKTLEIDLATNVLPSSGSVTVQTTPDSLVFIYARALFPKEGQNCADAIANNAFRFSPPSNFVAVSDFVADNCPLGASNRDGDGISIFGGSGFCDDVEKLTGSALSNTYSSGNTKYDDAAKYVLLGVAGGLPGGTQGAADPGNALCPNGKMVLKTNECDGDTISDAKQIGDALSAIPELRYSW